MSEPKNITASENLYLNGDKSAVVGEESPEQAYLLVIEGNKIPEWAVEQFGLSEKSQKTSFAATEKAKTPAANKLKTPAENK